MRLKDSLVRGGEFCTYKLLDNRGLLSVRGVKELEFFTWR